MEGLHEIQMRDGSIVTLDVDGGDGLPVQMRDGSMVSLVLTEAEAS